MAKRSHILVRNTLYNFSARVWFLLLHFFTAPYIVHKLGADAYGILAIVFVMLGYFGFLELGLGQAVIKYVSEYHTKDDYEGITHVVGSALIVYSIMGILGSAAICLISGPLTSRVLKVPLDLMDTARVVFCISAIVFLINMPRNVFGSIPKGLQRFDITNKIDITTGSLHTLLSVLLLYLGYFLQELLILNVIISLISMSIYILVSKKLLPGVSFGIKLDSAMFRRIFSFGGFVALDNVMTVLSSRINSFLTGVFLPISVVTYYVIPESVVSKASFLPSSFSQTVFPSFSELEASSSSGALQDLYLRSTKYVVVLTVPFILLFVIFAGEFLLFWMGPEVALQSTLPLRILGSAYLITFWAYTAVAGARGVNRPDVPAKLQILFAIANCVLCVFLIPSWGVTGAALAWSVHRFLLIPIFVYIIACRLLKIELARLWTCCFKWPLLLGVLLSLLAYPLKPFVSSLYYLIAICMTLSLLYLSASYFIALDEVDRQLFLRYIRKDVHAPSSVQ